MNADWDSIIEKIEKNQDLVETIFYVGPLNREVNEAEDAINDEIPLSKDCMIVDEQNGFRKHRSCLEHIFSLHSIIRNNNNIFASFNKKSIFT